MLTRWKCYSGRTDFEIADLFEGDGRRGGASETHRDLAHGGKMIVFTDPCGSSLRVTHVRYIHIAVRNGITEPVDYRHRSHFARRSMPRRFDNLGHVEPDTISLSFSLSFSRSFDKLFRRGAK